jgi:hypothetical protein
MISGGDGSPGHRLSAGARFEYRFSRASQRVVGARSREGLVVEQGVTYAQDIRPLFRDRDIESMSFAFDLSSYEDVRANAEAIYEKLAAGAMPCDGRWPDEQVERFRTWINQGSKP